MDFLLKKPSHFSLNSGEILKYQKKLEPRLFLCLLNLYPFKQMCIRVPLIYFLLNPVACHFMGTIGIMKTFYVVEIDYENLEKYMLNNTLFRENSWFWRKTEIVLILKMIPNKYYQTVSVKLVLRGILKIAILNFTNSENKLKILGKSL